ncbi:MAG TPA: hypothetical protein VGM39_01075 [Kofleriaceae bacterium]|jgi:hypothetical protein
MYPTYADPADLAERTDTNADEHTVVEQAPHWSSLKRSFVAAFTAITVVRPTAEAEASRTARKAREDAEREHARSKRRAESLRIARAEAARREAERAEQDRIAEERAESRWADKIAKAREHADNQNVALAAANRAAAIIEKQVADALHHEWRMAVRDQSMAPDNMDLPAMSIDELRASIARMSHAYIQAGAPMRPVAASAPVQNMMLPQTFYSFAEEQSALALETEYVRRMSAPELMYQAHVELRPAWQKQAAAIWNRYAVHICGAVAGLVLIVTYLIASAPVAPKHAAAVPAKPVMPVATLAATTIEPLAQPTMAAIAAPAVHQIVETAPVVEPVAAPVVAPVAAPVEEAPVVAPIANEIVKPAAKHTHRAAFPKIAKSAPKSGHRKIVLNTNSALGDLRVSRNR